MPGNHKSLGKFMMLAFTASALVGCERHLLDRKMEKLCKKDGGVKVYEAVTLSPTEYEIVFNYVTRKKSEEDYYGPEYRYVSTSEHLVGKEDDAGKGRGELIRHYQAIHRRRDNHLLGEWVWYTRVGGDLFTFGLQPSSNACPRLGYGLATAVFSKGQ